MIGSSGVVIPVLMAIGWFGDNAGELAGDVLPYEGLLLLFMILFISSSFKKTSEMSELIWEFVLCCLSFMKKVMFGPLDFLDILSSRMAFHTFSCSVTIWIRIKHFFEFCQVDLIVISATWYLTKNSILNLIIFEHYKYLIANFFHWIEYWIIVKTFRL